MALLTGLGMFISRFCYYCRYGYYFVTSLSSPSLAAMKDEAIVAVRATLTDRYRQANV